MRLVTRALTGSNFADLERLFGERGACGGCWCMTPRWARSDYERRTPAERKAALRRLARGAHPPGVLGYHGKEPVTWCSIEPRARIGSLARSRILAPVDDREVWSIVCLFIRKDLRGQGLSVAAVRGAAEYATRAGAACIEAYPVEPRKERIPDVFAYTGTLRTYLAAGFEEVARRSPTRPIVRRELSP